MSCNYHLSCNKVYNWVVLFSRPHSKEGSPAPFSKEGSPFSKEGSPSRFVTGRPIDQGVNTNKIKKLERSLSGKVTYDDLEGTRNQLPTYLETIECITDITVLQTMVSGGDFHRQYSAADYREWWRASLTLIVLQTMVSGEEYH